MWKRVTCHVSCTVGEMLVFDWLLNKPEGRREGGFGGKKQLLFRRTGDS